MKLKNNRKAFSLTELLIVLVVIAVLFAALAPILTKRRGGGDGSNEQIWNYVNDDDIYKDAYYDPGVATWTSTAYIGLSPDSLLSAPSPKSKVVIRASANIYKDRASGTSTSTQPQRQIQFRYGSGDGVNAGSLFFNGMGDLMLANNNDDFAANTKKGSNYNNTIAGLGTFSKIGYANYTTAYGANVMKGQSDNTAVGNMAIYTAVGNKVLYNTPFNSAERVNTFIGAQSGQAEPAATTRDYLNANTAIGSNAMGSPTFYGSNNTYLGYMVGNGEYSNLNQSHNNVLIGSQYYADTSLNNTILGYDTYVGGRKTMSNLTIAGYGACNSMDTNGVVGPRTCLGYTSGGTKGLASNPHPTPETFSKDSYDHVFLGGAPLGGFNGRAVLEVHNQKSSGIYGPQKPQVSPTVVLNSNLVVRGGVYLTRPDKGYLIAPKHDNISRDFGDTRCYRDKCCRSCGLFCCSWPARKRWTAFAYWCLDTADSYSSSSLIYDENTKCLPSSTTLSSYDFNSGCPNLGLSDIRLKENITENNDGIEAINALMPYNYTFKDDKNKTPQTGVIAQDLQKIFPNAVVKGNDGYLRIRWDEMFYAMINAIKTIDKKLTKIASDITNMESDVKQIKSEQKNIHKEIAALNTRAAKLERK